MARYDDLKTKWTELLKQEKAGTSFDLARLSPGRFCVHISDAGGESMGCYSSVELTGFFDDALDALGFYRFADIPRILDWDAGNRREPCPDAVEAYLPEYKAEDRERFEHLIALIDSALKSGAISTPGLSLIRDRFNTAFGTTNPEVQILAWGSLAETLSSDYFDDAFAEDIEEEADETDDEYRPSTTLKALLESGRFDENAGDHLSLAAGFLERRMAL